MNNASLELNIMALLPAASMVVFALLVMLVDAFGRGARTATARAFTPWVALLGVFATSGLCFWLLSQPVSMFQGMAILDRYALGVDFVVLTAAGLTILVSARYIPRVNAQVGEYYALLLLISAGMMVMGAAMDLMVVFLALETFSLGLYILAGLRRTDELSSEAAIKYFLLGAFASAFFVYGAAFVYGATGSTQFEQIAAAADPAKDLTLLYVGIALLVVGFGFKVSLVPFHMWTPDVYQGSPTPVTAFMSAATKAAAFAAFYRLFVIALPGQQAVWGPALATLAVLTMTLGNLAALRQSSLKRLLAYSSISHAGYILVGLTPGTQAGADASLFYLITYAFMNIGAFAVVTLLEKQGEMDADGARLRGLGQRKPLLAAVMAIFMFSLAGVPPFAGFFAKFFVFAAAVQGGWAWLAAIAMLNSAIGAYYYLRVTVVMYFSAPDAETVSEVKSNWPLNVGIGVALAFTILLGIFPALWANLLQTGVVQVALR